MKENNLLLTKRDKFSLLKQSLHDSIVQNGIKITIQKILKHIMYKIKGIDFSEEEIINLTIKSSNKHLATIYGSCGDDMLRILLDTILKIDTTILSGTFLDYGSGKGMAIIYAKKYGFAQSIGVEFAKELHETALRNIKKFKLNNVKSIHMDAVNFIPNQNIRVIYFLNPFHKKVLYQVLNNILKNRNNFLHDIYLIYNIPIYKETFDHFKEFQKLVTCKYKDNKAFIYKLAVQ